MRLSTLRRCCNLRTLGLEGGQAYSSAEIKRAFVAKAKSLHPDAGGDAATFRQLKDAYDALRSRSREEVAGADWSSVYRDARADSPSCRPSKRNRAHIYEERFNHCDCHGSGTFFPNESTRNFYRPYTANYHDPRSTGFTRAEVARAVLAMRLHILKRIFWKFLVYGSALYLLLEFWRDRSAVRRRGSDEPSNTFLVKKRTPASAPSNAIAASGDISAVPFSDPSTNAKLTQSTAFPGRVLSHTLPNPFSASADYTATSLDMSDGDHSEDYAD